MAAYFLVHIVCDRCGQLIGNVEIKFGALMGEIDNLPEGCVADPDSSSRHYCEGCAEKYKDQLGL